MLVVPNICFGETNKHSYQLLDSPDGSINYRLTVSITDTLIEYYNNKNHYVYSYDFSKFVTPDALKPIADDLWTIYDSEEDFANGVLMLVHQIPYIESDPQKYPVETIAENKGDCDLFSTLAASIMNAGGLDVVLLLLERHDHMWVGVHLPESPKDARSQAYFYRYGGKKYYVAETTGGKWEIGWRVGECPEILQRAGAKVIPLTNYEGSSPGQVSSSYTLPDSAAIHMSFSTNFVISQSTVEMNGSLYPSLAEKKVTLYVSSFNSPIIPLATVVTDSEGYYSYTWDSPPGGIYSVRANWSGDEDYTGADSSIFRIVVFPSEFLYIGIVLIFFSTILLIVVLETRNKSKNQESFDEWDFADYPQDF
ncbi:Ig-like domain-containing protein [Candidatus Bathyarchaeota archaeon]|nr:Ig-like domain-containing protein [Candidatus Bathyarchaeota archaeon]